jgi:hypothetical protein
MVMAVAGCRAQPKTSARPQGVGWHTIGSWSGHGSTQTESMTTDSGELRIRWHTSHETADAGRFRLSAHSSISGRELGVAVDRSGTGEGIGYIDSDPHVFYMVIQSENLDWAFTLEEAVAGTVEAAPPSRQP